MRKLFAMAAAAAMLVTSGAAEALTVDFDKLPQASIAPLLETKLPGPVKHGYRKRIKQLEVKNYQLKVKDSDAPRYCFSDGRRTQRDGFGVSGGLSALRIEKVIDKKDGSAAFLLQDIVADASRGSGDGEVFLAKETEIPLRKVAEASTGVKVYAMRDTTDAIQFVIVGPERPKRLRKGNQIDDRQLILGDGSRNFGNFNNSNCGHVRIELRAKTGRSAAATVRNTVIINSTERPHGATADVKVRGMYSHLSVSKMRKDDAPVVSVSFGWASSESIIEAILDDEEV